MLIFPEKLASWVWVFRSNWHIKANCSGALAFLRLVTLEYLSLRSLLLWNAWLHEADCSRTIVFMGLGVLKQFAYKGQLFWSTCLHEAGHFGILEFMKPITLPCPYLAEGVFWNQVA